MSDEAEEWYDDDDEEEDGDDEEEPVDLSKHVSKSKERQDLIELVNKGRSGAKSSHTRATYCNRLGVLRDRYFAKIKKSPVVQGNHAWMSESEDVADFIESEWPASFETRKLNFESLIAALKHLKGAKYEKAIEAFREHMAKLASLSDNRYIAQSMSAAEKEKWLPWEEIEKAVSKYRESYWPRLVSKTTWSEEEFRLFQEILLSTCYTALPPLRLEWALVKIRDFDRAKDNIVDYGTQQVRFVNYKTSKFYQENVLDIQDKTLWQMLLTAKQMSQPDDDPYLFLNSNGQRFKKPGAFSQWMSRTFLKICKKPLTAGMLRKAFVTKITADAQLPRTKELLALQTASRQMGHAPSMQLKYRRFDDGGSLEDQIAAVEAMRLVTPGHTRDLLSTKPMTTKMMGGVSRKR